MTKVYINTNSIMKTLPKIIIITIIVTMGFMIYSIEKYGINEIVAQEAGIDKEYLFAEDTIITGVFYFNSGTEINRFEIFTQKSGFQASEPFIFTLSKIVGKTPLLHLAADKAFLFRNSQGEKQSENEFDVKIIISQGKEQQRSFSYNRCYVNDYSVQTRTDNEEGWTQGKGFAVVDNFEIQCGSYQPNNPVYEDMTTIKEKADAKSSMDYQKSQINLGR